MTLDDFLPRLSAVRSQGTHYVALCPAHADRHPSLQVTAGERGILLKCWSGCTVAEICTALSIHQSDLFFDGSKAPDMDATLRKKRAVTAKRLAKGRRIDALREADRTIRAATGVDISTWPVDNIDAALEAVCMARMGLQHA